MKIEIQGLKPHTRAERWSVVEQLVPLWKEKFGNNLLAVAVSASMARGTDAVYSDVELDVFVREKPSSGEDGYLQRVVDGMLVEAIYYTPEEFLQDRTSLARHWYMSDSDTLVPVYNQDFVSSLMAQVRAIRHSEVDFIRAASRERFELQESFSKVLNAAEKDNQVGISLLVMDASMRLLHVLALLNRHSFTTFGQFIAEARTFTVKPERFDDLLDVLVEGTYRDLSALRELFLTVFAGLESLFARRGVQLYQDELDPNLPNRPYLEPNPSQ
jgi:kanamycin nucleotidyltransferase